MNPDGDIRALVNRAWEAQYANPRDSHDWACEALAAANAADDGPIRALANLTIGNFKLRYATPDDARTSLKAAEEEFTALGDHRGAVLARTSLARARMMEGGAQDAYGMFRAILKEEAGSLSPWPCSTSTTSRA